MRLPGPKAPKNWQNLHRVAKLGLGLLVGDKAMAMRERRYGRADLRTEPVTIVAAIVVGVRFFREGRSLCRRSPEKMTQTSELRRYCDVPAGWVTGELLEGPACERS
jgi:hypothetical protein